MKQDYSIEHLRKEGALSIARKSSDAAQVMVAKWIEHAADV